MRFSKLPPYGPGRVIGREELVAQVAVAVLDVDELEARPAGPSGPPPRSRRSAADLGVAEQRRIVVGPMPNLRVQHGMMIGDPRLQPALCGWGGRSGRNGSVAGRPAGRRPRGAERARGGPSRAPASSCRIEPSFSGR